MTEQATASHSKAHVWLSRILGASTVIFAVVILGVVGVAAFLGHKVYTKLEKLDRTQDVLVTDLKVLNEQSVIREIIEAKLPTLSPDQRAKIAFEIYDGCRRHDGYPAYIAMGLIEKESCWKPAVSNGDAVGLMQVRPSSAMVHFRQLGVAFSSEALWDPVMNVTIGLRILFDCQDAAVLMGRSPRGQYVRGLYDYNGGGEPYARQVLQLSTAYQTCLDAPIQRRHKEVEEVKP